MSVPGAVKRSGKREKWPVVLRIRKVRASSLLSTASKLERNRPKKGLSNRTSLAYVLKCKVKYYLRGSIAIKIAFSWTCHPNMKDPRAQIIMQRRKPRAPFGLRHVLKRTGYGAQKEKIYIFLAKLYRIRLASESVRGCGQ